MRQLLQGAGLTNRPDVRGAAGLTNMGRTSGSSQRSGVTARVGAPLPNGVVAPVSTSASRVLAACCVTTDIDGTICATTTDLCDRTGLSRPTVVAAMAELVAAGLVHSRGRTRAQFRYVDEKVRRALQMSAGRRSMDTGRRELRSRCGGFERAMRAAQRREQAAVARADALAERVAPPATPAEVHAHLRAETLHALACIDGPEGCDRCAQLEALLTEGEAGEAEEVARDRLEDADEVKAAAVAVVDAFAAGGVGARAQQMAALQTLERLVR